MVAVLGTGIIGSAMARVLHGAGHDVVVWNRSPERVAPLREDGIRVAGSAADAVRDQDVVVTTLFDAESVQEVMEPLLGDLDGVWLQMSTVGVEGTARLAGLATEAGVTMLDAPVVGTKAPAEQGKLVVLVAGDRSAESVVRPVLEAVGSRTQWVADVPGPATALKLVVNSWVGSINAAVGQAVALSRALDLDPRLFLETIEGGPTDTPYAHLKGEMMIGHDYPTAFGLDNARKDLGLMRDAAAASGMDTGLLEALLAVYAAASDRGHGGDDMSAVVEGFIPSPAPEGG